MEIDDSERDIRETMEDMQRSLYGAKELDCNVEHLDRTFACFQICLELLI